MPDAVGSCFFNLLSDLLFSIFLIRKWLDNGLGLYIEGEGERRERSEVEEGREKGTGGGGMRASLDEEKADQSVRHLVLRGKQ